MNPKKKRNGGIWGREKLLPSLSNKKGWSPDTGIGEPG